MEAPFLLPGLFSVAEFGELKVQAKHTWTILEELKPLGILSLHIAVVSISTEQRQCPAPAARDRTQHPPSPAVAIETEAAFLTAMFLFLSDTFSVAGRERGIRDVLAGWEGSHG